MGAVRSAFSPSAAHRWAECPSSVHLGEAAKGLGLVPEAGEAAREGTVAMAVLERMLRHSLDAPEAALLAAEEDAIDVTEIKPDMFMAISYAARKMRPLIDDAFAWGVEERVAFLDVFGTCDFFAVKEESVGPGDYVRSLTVVDYKHGVGIPVSAEDNHQLILYAAGLAVAHSLMEHNSVRLVICQPRHIEGGWQDWETTVGEVLKAAKRMLDGRNRVGFQTGEHCKFCPAALLCPARRQEIQDTGGDVPQDPADLAGLLERGARVRDLLRAAENAALAKIQAGRVIPGWTVEEGRGSFNWRAGVEVAARETFGDLAFTTEMLTPAAIRDKLPNGKEFFDKHAFRKPGRPTLKRGDAEPRKIEWPKGSTDE